MTETPNRYGRDSNVNSHGDKCCCHGIELYRVCGECNWMLERLSIQSLYKQKNPTLVGTGDVVEPEFFGLSEEMLVDAAQRLADPGPPGIMPSEMVLPEPEPDPLDELDELEGSKDDGGGPEGGGSIRA